MEIKLYEKNAKIHNKKQLKALAKVVKEIGWRQPVEVNQDGVIVVGHGRWLCYNEYKDELPEVWVINGKGETIMGKHDGRELTDEQERMWRLADNQLNAMTGFDMDLVIDELKLMDEHMLDLSGFDSDLVIESEDRDDDVPEILKKPKSKLGDLYELPAKSGWHRVLCGDSTSIDEVDILMNGREAHMCFTDPPYNVDYQGSATVKNKKDKILNDNMSNEEFKNFLNGAIFNIVKNVGGVFMYV